MIIHEPILNVDKAARLYSEKDGVEVKYVCTSALGGEASAGDIFYRSTPHPAFGNRYFTLRLVRPEGITIGNADKVEELDFGMIEDEEGNLHYSAHRHDYKSINGSVIDGGRAYTRGWNWVDYRIKDGEFVKGI
ncbi:MAG: hypothetical protein COA78_17515 [Blastopirellula sp.]|nr:MAG: hypothetical protein COA78_17515 [Blastopirellula sp.]